MNILLDYFFKITAENPTPPVSTAFLKQVLAVVKPKVGVTPDVISLCTSTSQIAALTDNQDVQRLLTAGMTRVFVLPTNDLHIGALLEGRENDFFTILISSDFEDADIEATEASLVKANLTFTAKEAGVPGNDISIAFITGGTAGSEVVTVVGKAISVSMASGVSTATQLKAAIDAKPEAAELIYVAIAPGQSGTAQAAFAVDNLEDGDGLNLGAFEGVVGISSDDDTFLAEQAAIVNRVGFHVANANGAKNMFTAFGKLLSDSLDWKNQQYIEMPLADDVDTLSLAEQLFEDRISFVINDTQFGPRLALFTAGGQAIIAPYVKRNLELDLQSRALQYVSLNQPSYTLVQASLLEDELQKVTESYIDRDWIEDGTANVTLGPEKFVGAAEIEISEPSALWRIKGKLKQNL